MAAVCAQPPPMRLVKFLAHAGCRLAAGRGAHGGRGPRDGRRRGRHRPGAGRGRVERVALDGSRVEPEPREVHALNKPAGVVSTARDTHGRPKVVELVRSRRRLYPVGRLDADTTGLILLTNDGELAERLTHPRYGVKKVYRAACSRRGCRRARSTRWEGVQLEDGLTAPAPVRQLAPGVIEIGIREGRKRQVRRMLEAVGHRVVELERVAFGRSACAARAGKSRRLTSARWSGCAGDGAARPSGAAAIA